MFKSVTSLVESLSLDEVFLDSTSVVRDLPVAMPLASTIKQRIKDETELTASAGLSFNTFLAKLAFDAHKTDGLTFITPEQTPAFLDAPTRCLSDHRKASGR